MATKSSVLRDQIRALLHESLTGYVCGRLAEATGRSH